MAGTGDFKVAVKLHADASQYTAEFTKASQLAQTFASQLQTGGSNAASGLQTAATAAQALGAATASGTQQASAGLAQASTAAQTLGSNFQATSTQATQAGQGLDNLSKSSRETTQSQQQSRAAGDALIAMLRDQIATAGKSTEELLRYRAAQSGVAAEAAPLILQLQNQRAAQEAAAVAARQEEAALREAAAGKQRATAAQEAFMAGLREQIAVSGKSSEELLRYRAAQSGVAAEAAPLIQQFQNQRAAQEAAAVAARQEEAAQREAQAAKQRAAAAQDQFLAGLREEIALRGKSTTEVLQYRAAQLGVSSEAAQSIRILDDANKRGAISAGQHAAAMRMLPAQMTDVVTSVASGMPIWMVAIQQGGQIKDSFGGAGAAARAMLGAITPLAAGLAIVTAAAGLTAAAYYQGSAEADRFRQVTTLNGNAAGVTTEALSRMSREIDGIYGTQSKAAEGLAVLAGSGKIARDSLVEFTAMAVKMEDLAGRSIEKTREELEQLGTKPAEASAKLNESYNYLTPAVYRQIKALEDQGRSEEAAALAQKTYSDAMSARADTLQGELGYVERGWRNVRDLAKEAWDAFLNIGRPTTVADKADERVKALEAEIKRRKQLNADRGIRDGKATADLEQQLENAKGLSQLSVSAGKAVADAIVRENTARQAGIDLQREASRYTSDAVKKRNELAQAEAKWLPLTKAAANASAEEVKAAADAAKDYAAVVAGIEKKYSKSSTGGISISDNQLAGLQSQLEAAKLYYQQLQTLGSSASELNAGERESLKLSEQITLATNAKTRAKLEEAKAIADALGVQLRTNDGLEKSFKAEQQQHDEMVKGTDAIIQRAKDQEAANAVVGKGRTAIEQMTLAELEHQLAQAQGGKATAQQIADLEARIEAQKRWVSALGQADYKAVMAHADEMLRNAQELAKVYEDELALTGLTGLEREKIVAARQVELKYAQAIDAVNKGTLSDTQKEAARIRFNEARSIESANAVAKAKQNYMAKADEEINKSLTDALMRGFEAGKGFAENLADTVENMFNTMVLRPVISAVMAPVSGAINSVVQSALSAVGLGSGVSQSGLGSWQNLFSTGKSVYQAATGQNAMLNQALNWMGWGSSGALSTASSTALSASATQLSAAATELSTGSALDIASAEALKASAESLSIGAKAQATSGAGAGFGTALSYVGYAAAIAAGMKLSASAYDEGYRLSHKDYFKAFSVTGGIAPPSLSIDTKILESLGISGRTANILTGASLWAKGLAELGLTSTPHTGAGAIYQNGSTQEGAGIYNQSNFGMGVASEYAASAQASISSVAAQAGATLDSIAQAFGKEGGFSVATAYADDISKDAAWGSLKIADALGNVLLDWEQSRTSRWAPREFSNGEAGRNEYFAAAQSGVLSVIQGLDIASWAKDMFAVAQGSEGLQTALQSVAVTLGQFEAIGKTVAMFADLSGDMQTAMLTSAGGIDALTAKVSSFNQNFYTESERMEVLSGQVRDALSAIDISIDPAMGDKAKAEFKAAVKTATDAGKGELVVQLLSLNESFATAANYAQSLASTVDKATASMSGLEVGYSTYAKLAETVAGYGDTSALQSYLDQLNSSYNDALGIAGQQAVLEAITSAEQALASSGASASATERAALTARQTALQKELSVAQDLLTAAQSLGDYVKSLYASEASGLSDTQRLDVLRSQYVDLRNAGNAGDAQALQQVQGAASEYLSLLSELSVDRSDYAAAAAQIAGELGTLSTLQSASASAASELAQKQLDTLTVELSAQTAISRTTQELTKQLLERSRLQMDQGMRDAAEQLIATDSISAGLAELPPVLAALLSQSIASTLAPSLQSIAAAVASGAKSSSLQTIGQAASAGTISVSDANKYAAGQTGATSGAHGWAQNQGWSDQQYYDAVNVVVDSYVQAGDIAGLATHMIDYGHNLSDVAAATGMSTGDVAAWLLQSGATKLPSLSVGTNWLPDDMIIQAHRGERVIPEADNRDMIAALNAPRAASMSGVERLLSDIATLLDAIKNNAVESTGHALQTATVLTRVTDSGDGLVLGTLRAKPSNTQPGSWILESL